MKLLIFLQNTFKFLARPRVLAVIVLTLLVIVPGTLYYLFMMKKTSGLTVLLSSERDQEITVSIRSQLTKSWLPLLDRAFSYEKKCTGKCAFDMLPPAEYSVHIEQDGSQPIQDTVFIEPGQKKEISYSLVPHIRLQEVAWKDNLLSPDEKILLQKKVDEKFGPDIAVIDRDVSGKIFVYKNLINSSEIALLKDDSIKNIHTFPFVIEKIKYDAQNKTFIFQTKDGEIGFTQKDFSQIEFANTKNIGIKNAFYRFGNWFYTDTNGGIYKHGKIKDTKNPRFNEFADFSEKYRVGYISKDDEIKLSLSNFPKGKSILLLLDRSNARTIEIDTGNIAIEGVFYDDGKVYVSDTDKKVYKVIGIEGE